jgi:hypothetical protein
MGVVCCAALERGGKRFVVASQDPQENRGVCSEQSSCQTREATRSQLAMDMVESGITSDWICIVHMLLLLMMLFVVVGDGDAGEKQKSEV